jgi:hypothetical protein
MRFLLPLSSSRYSSRLDEGAQHPLHSLSNPNRFYVVARRFFAFPLPPYPLLSSASSPKLPSSRCASIFCGASVRFDAAADVVSNFSSWACEEDRKRDANVGRKERRARLSGSFRGAREHLALILDVFAPFDCLQLHRPFLTPLFTFISHFCRRRSRTEEEQARALKRPTEGQEVLRGQTSPASESERRGNQSSFFLFCARL